jgi:hypothetical protein
MDRESIRISYFYKEYSKNKHHKINIGLYKKILLKFLTIYFYDVYFLNKPLYFLFGGNIRLNKCGNWIKKNWKKNTQNELIKTSQSIGLFWYNRPSFRFEYAMKIKKLTGSSNRLPVIENEWKQSKNVDDLLTVNNLVHQQHCSITIKN